MCKTCLPKDLKEAKGRILVGKASKEFERVFPFNTQATTYGFFRTLSLFLVTLKPRLHLMWRQQLRLSYISCGCGCWFPTSAGLQYTFVESGPFVPDSKES